MAKGKVSRVDASDTSTMQTLRAATTATAKTTSDSRTTDKPAGIIGDGAPPPVRLTPASGIGFNTNLRDMLLYVNKNEVIYAIGKYVALQNIHSQKMSFFEPPPSKDHDSTSSVRLGDICALAITVKRNYVAIGRSAHSSLRRTESSISIYCLKAPKEGDDSARWSRLTPIRTLTYDTHSFTSVAFSHDGKFVVAQSTTSEWTFALWDWTRARQVAVAEAHSKVTRICFNPVDVAQISTSGGVHLRLWRLTEPTCRPFATFNSANSAIRYVDHTWVGTTDGIVAVLDNGDVQFFRNGELLRTIPMLHHGHVLQCVQSFKTSVVVGGDRGWLSVLEVDAFNGADIHMVKRMRIDSKEPVLALSMDAAGTGFMCATPSYYGAYDLSNLCLLREDDEFVTLMTFTALPRLVSVTTLATSSRKHVVAVTGKRSTGATLACVYGQADTRGLLHHTFVHVVPTCIDFHPSGFELLLSVSAQLHIYHVLYDSIRLAFEVDVKHASTVAYSGGGNYFVALVDDKSIYVYRNFGGLEPSLVAVCSGREANVLCLRWGLDDARFYSSDDCGALLEWGMGSDGSFSATQATSTGPSTAASTSVYDRALVFSSLAVTRHPSTSHALLAASCTSDADVSVVHVWCDGRLNTPPLKSAGIDAKITVLEFGPACVVCAGTAHGSVLVFSWEASGGGLSVLSATPAWFDLSVASILSLRSCLNDRVLLAATVDGTVISYTVDIPAPSPRFHADTLLPAHTKALHVLQAAPETQFSAALVTDDLCLVDRASVAERSLRITDLETEKEQLKMEKEILSKLSADQLSLLDRERQSELRQAKAAWEAKMKAVEGDMHTKSHDAHTAMLEMKQEHERSLQTMQSIFTTKLSAMTDVCRQLERQVVAERQRVDDARFGGDERQMVLRGEWEAAMASTVATYDAKVAALTHSLDRKQKEYDELLSQMNDDSLIHLGAMQAAVDNGKAAQVSQQEETKAKISSLQQQLRMMLNALTTKDDRVKQATLEANRLHLAVDALNYEIALERKTAAKAVAACSVLEARVADQARQIEGLDEMNNARLCKLKTMQSAITTKEQDIHGMRRFVEELHAENSAVVEDANEMDEAHGQMKRRVAFFERSVTELKRQLVDAKAVTTACCRDLGILIEREQHGTRVSIDDIVKLYHKYDFRTNNNRVVRREMASDEAVIQELTRQNKCVEDQQRKLRTRLDAMTHERQKLVSVFSTDNTKLLQELNVMAQRNHELQVRNGVLEVDAAKRLRKGRGVEDRGGMQASQSLPDLPVVAATGESEASNQVEPTTTTVVDDQGPRIYIPCGVSVGAGPQKAKDLSPLKPLQRPRSSKPKQTTQPRPVNSMAQTKLYARRRPQSAHPTKSY